MVNENLAVAVTTGANADSRDPDRVCDHARHTIGHTFEDDREAAGFGERHGIVDDPASCIELLALHLEATDGVDGLRRQAEMAHHRDLGVEDGRDRVETLPSTFEFDRTRPRANQLGGVAHGLFSRHVVAHPR